MLIFSTILFIGIFFKVEYAKFSFVAIDFNEKVA